MLTRDIHMGKPTVDVALNSLKLAIKHAKQAKEKLLEIIVGYGSTGGTHKIKTAALQYLQTAKENGEIKDFITGDMVDIFNPRYQNYVHKDLIPKAEHIKKNRGSIFIAL